MQTDQPSESEESGKFYDLNKGDGYLMGMGGKKHVLHTLDSLLLTLYNYTLAPNNDSCKNLKS